MSGSDATRAATSSELASGLAPGLEPVAVGGLLLLGCGKMGGAMLEGWLAAGLPGDAVHVMDPGLGDRAAALSARGVRCALTRPASAAAVIVAVKPQLLAEALPSVAPLAGPRTLFVSVVAGAPLAFFEKALGAATPIVRAMPNTPAAVGRGVTALFANAAGQASMPLAEALARSVGQTVRLDSEDQMDAVTGVSGSGPAYVFHMIEALAAAGVAAGLSEALAMRLARATVTGAGELAHRSGDEASALREAVTSPAGTTAAGLSVLMGDRGAGTLTDLMTRTVAAAAARSRELGR